METEDRVPMRGGGLDEGTALSELEETIEALVQRLDPSVVAVLKAGQSQRPPRPTVTQHRAWIEAAIMIACARSDVELKWVSHDAVQATLGARPNATEFRALAADRLSADAPPRWAQRSPAYGAALVAMEERA